jgi:hypothetical protein
VPADAARADVAAVLNWLASNEQEDCMPFVTGDIVATAGEETPFKVVFKQGEKVLAEWPVESKEAGEQEILEIIQDLAD